MKILLINSSINLDKFGKYANLMESMPCIGIAYIAAVLLEAGHQVDVVDDFQILIGPEGIAEHVRKTKPDMVGISCLTPSAPRALETCRRIKAVDKQITTVLGNVHASYFADDILRGCPEVDYIIHGEGEYAMRELVEFLERDKDPTSLQSLSCRVNGGPRRNPDRPLLKDLDALPYPAWDLFPYTEYGLLPFVTIDRPILTMSASRGCPYRCTFCSLTYLDPTYRFRDPIKLVDEVEFLVNKYGVKQVGFVDPIFGLRKDLMDQFCQEMIARKLPDKVCWICETRQDLVTEPGLQLMREAGCRRILFGMESGSEATLTTINKNFTPVSGARAVAMAKKAGIETVGLFMIGLPEEDWEACMKTVEYACKTELDFAKFGICIPLPGSEMYREFQRKPDFKREDWENYTTFQPDPNLLVKVTERMSSEQLIRAQRIANRRFYFRPKIVLKHLFHIKTITPKGLLNGALSLLH